MKTQLRLAPHSQIPGEQVIEIWYNNKFVGQVTGADNRPGVRIISKHQVDITRGPAPFTTVFIETDKLI